MRLRASIIPLMWAHAALIHDLCPPPSPCRILQFPRPVKLDDLKAKAKVAFGQTMDLHYTNNEVSSDAKRINPSNRPGPWRISYFSLSLSLCLSPTTPLLVGDPVDHSGRPGQSCRAAWQECSHEEPEDPAGAAEPLSGGCSQACPRENKTQPSSSLFQKTSFFLLPLELFVLLFLFVLLQHGPAAVARRPG